MIKNRAVRQFRILKTAICALCCLVAISTPAYAVSPGELAFVIGTLYVVMHGALVFWMAAGFAMLEAGLVQTKSVSTILLKNITLVAIAAIAFALIGYNLMFDDVAGGIVGSLKPWTMQETSPVAGNGASIAPAAHWFFQMVFVATAASIVSGTLAERIKLWPFFTFTFILTAFIYPIVGAWHWGGGWLAGIGFVDFAGSTLVHSVGGWAALTGAIVLGPRRGKFDNQGRARNLSASALPLATLGTLILWLGWYGFNGGSIGRLETAADAQRLASIYMNTTLGAAGGILAAITLMQIHGRKIDVRLALNGALAGLVSITASPDTPGPWLAVVIGSVGGLLVVLSTPILNRLKIDDVVGAVPVHLVAGIWGTLAVCFSHDTASILTQIIGLASIGGFVICASCVTWITIRYTIGLRLSRAEEVLGLDRIEVGTPAYPEFRLND